MTQDEINGSELIVVFLGWAHEGHLRNHYSVPKEQNFTELNQTCYRLSEMKWHKDWNWMMYAWNSLRKKVFKQYNEYYPSWFMLYIEVWQMQSLLADRDMCFGILVEAIKSYNEQKTKHL